MPFTSLELIDSRSARILSLIVLLIIPSVISGLQIGLSTVNTGLRRYPSLLIIFSALYYILLTIIPAWSMFISPIYNLKFEWFIMMILLYTLWSTLLFTFGEVIWSYIVLVIIFILSIFPLHAVFKHIHPAFSIFYLYAFFWLLVLLGYETYLLYKGDY
jgi:hypothetical protein